MGECSLRARGAFPGAAAALQPRGSLLRACLKLEKGSGCWGCLCSLVHHQVAAVMQDLVRAAALLRLIEPVPMAHPQHRRSGEVEPVAGVRLCCSGA